MTNSRFWKNLHPLIRRKRKPNYEDDTNFAILNAIDTELKDLEEETLKSKIQSSLKTATGMFLEEYGDFFGVFRKHKEETDRDYRERIVAAVDIPRGTNESIRRAVRGYLEDNTLGIEVYEPWVDIFYLNKPESRTSGKHKMQGVYYHFAVIDVFIGSPFEEDIVNIINDYKPAGVTLHTTYDPSLKPYDPNKDTKYGTTPYVETKTNKFEITIQIDTQRMQPIQGSILMSNAMQHGNIFNLNRSQMSGLDKLSGGYGTRLGNLHLAGKSRNFMPKDDMLMRDIHKTVKIFDEEFYKDRDSINKNDYKVRLQAVEQLYAILNLDELIQARHPKINRFEGDFDKLLNGELIQVSFKADRGIEVAIQAYDFKEHAWVDLTKKITTNKLNVLSAKIPKAGTFLNKNRIAFIRVKTSTETTLKINHIYAEYRSYNKRVPLGIEMRAKPTHPIVVKKLKTIPEDVPYPY